MMPAVTLKGDVMGSKNFGDDKQAAEEYAAENDGEVVEQGHDNGAGKWETDSIVITKDD